MKLVRFNCGCIGFEDGNVIKACDTAWDDDEFWLSSRTPRHVGDYESGTEVSDRERDTIVDLLGALIRDGYKFRKIQSLLKD